MQALPLDITIHRTIQVIVYGLVMTIVHVPMSGPSPTGTIQDQASPI